MTVNGNEREKIVNVNGSVNVKIVSVKRKRNEIKNGIDVEAGVVIEMVSLDSS